MTLLKKDSELRSKYRRCRVNGTPPRDTHRRVVEAILGRTLSCNEVVHHIDGNKLNNDPTNLKVMTRSEHVRLHLAQGDYDRMYSPESRAKSLVACKKYWETHVGAGSKVVARCDKSGNVLEVYDSVYRVKQSGYDHRHVSACCLGKRKTHKGYTWKFVDDTAAKTE